MVNQMVNQSKTKRHQFFKEETKGFNPDAILIPDNALALRNNCKEGRWMLGDTNYGDRLKLVAVKFSRYLHKGNDVISPGTPIGQLWFCPMEGGIGTDEQGNETKLAHNLVYYTLLKNSKSGKSGSLLNFGQKAAQLEASGYDFREVVWSPRFVKKSGTIINDAGQPEAASWFVLDWNYVLPEKLDDATYNKIGNLINILSDGIQMEKLLDPMILSDHEPIDGLTLPQVVEVKQKLVLSAASIALPPLQSGNGKLMSGAQSTI